MAPFLGFRSVRDEHGAAHRQPGEVDELWRCGARHLLLEDDLLDQRRAAAAVLAWPVHAAPSRLVELALPALAVRDPFL